MSWGGILRVRVRDRVAMTIPDSSSRVCCSNIQVVFAGQPLQLFRSATSLRSNLLVIPWVYLGSCIATSPNVSE